MRPHVLYQKVYFSKKLRHPSRDKPARIHANLRGATTLYGIWKRKSSQLSSQLIRRYQNYVIVKHFECENDILIPCICLSSSLYAY